MRRFVIGLVLIASAYGSARLAHHTTKGFRLTRLIGNTTCIEGQKSSPLTGNVRDLLSQKFTYYARGKQSFALLSEDGKTILKLFNNRYQNRLKRLALFPSLGPLKSWKAEKMKYHRGKLRRTFNSYELAHTLLKEEAGILYFHPQVTEKALNVQVIDNLKISHTIDLSQCAFLLQKRGDLPYEYLSRCAKGKELAKVKEAIESLVALYKRKMELGIDDRDPLIRANVGIIDGKAMQIDIGLFVRNEAVKAPAWQKEELRRVTLPLKHFLENHHPEFAPYLEDALSSKI